MLQRTLQHFGKQCLKSIKTARPLTTHSHVLAAQGGHSAPRRSTVITDADGGTIVRSPYSDVTVSRQTAGEFMFACLDEHRHLELLIDNPTGRRFTGATLKELSIKVASGLSRLGYRKGDVVMVLSPNCPEFTVLCLACFAIGVTITTANPAYTPHEIARQLIHSEARAVFTQTPLLAGVQQAINDISDLKSATKDVFIMDGEGEGYRPFSLLQDDTGTAFPENVPKGIVLTHTNMVAALTSMMNGQLRYRCGEEKVMGLLPFFHVYGMLVVQLVTLCQGATTVINPKFEPNSFLQAIQDHKVTYIPVVPPMILFLAKSALATPYDISSLQTLLCSAASLSSELTEQVEHRLGINLLQGYGLSEACLTHCDELPHKRGTIGTLTPNTVAKVVDPVTYQSLPAGATGELLLKGPHIMTGYLKNPTVTKETLIDGWFHTGDLGHFDDGGYFTITGRLKEMIKYKGFQVAPAELEAVLTSHDAVEDAAVVGVKAGEGDGEVPRAYVVMKAGAQITTEQLVNFVAEHVAAYKGLRGGVRFLDTIPKSASGKILRRLLND